MGKEEKYSASSLLLSFCPRVLLLADTMKLLLVSCLAAAALAHNADYTQLQFAQFKEQVGKTYLSRAEHNLRFDIFKTNMKKMEEHNKSGASWKMGMNQFSDLTQAEFESMYLGGYIRLQRQSTAQCGTDSTPMDGTACVGGPGNDEQHVCGQCGVLFDVSYPLGAHEFSMP